MERTISIIWSTEDVKNIRPDLDDNQAYEVLKYAKRHHDAEIGINWNVLETIAEDLFPVLDNYDDCFEDEFDEGTGGYATEALEFLYHYKI